MTPPASEADPTPDPAPLKLVLFDCDGTLVDSQHMIVAAMRDAHAAHGVVLPERDRLLSVVGLSLPEAFAMLSQGDRAYPVEALVDAYRNAFTRLRNAEPPEPMFEGAREVLDALRQRDDLVLGMVTGKARRGVDRVLKAHDMEGWFTTIQTADDAPSKPHPAMVFQAMGEIGARPEETVVVGDTTYDVSMALQAGASALGVGWGYHEVGDLQRAGADQIVHRFDEVPAAIFDLLARRRAIAG
ncbi:HAD-IA family hydrolase [Xanthobacter autotrophicus]|uniref:HAD-IA family hydrolase n=1 Tax=Xanthobacter autotrophicus TaxID=280 RepID=UPI00372647D6